jgi:hypothetical protein
VQSNNINEVVILGVSRSGQVFRPSDWAERLAGVISSIRPTPAEPGDHFSYSPWCVPNTFNGQKCVVIHTDIRAAHVMAWDFLMGFAKDNDLQVIFPEQASPMKKPP